MTVITGNLIIIYRNVGQLNIWLPTLKFGDDEFGLTIFGIPQLPFFPGPISFRSVM